MIHRYKRDAANELLASVEHYEALRSGLGGEFLDEIEAAIETIKEAPMRWPQTTEGARRYRLDHFPFHVVYQVKNDAIAIVAIAHTSRKPGYWQDRLNS